MHLAVRSFFHTFKHEYLWDLVADHNQILSVASLGRGRAALRFGADRIRTLVSMSTDTSHRVIMGKTVSSGLSTSFDQSLFIPVGNDDIHKSLNVFNIRSDRTTDYGLSCS